MIQPYNILLADDHVGFRRGVRKILEEIPGVRVTGEAGDRCELFELMEQSPPELVILDMSMPDLQAWEGTRLIRLRYPGTRVLIMVMDHLKEYLAHGLAAGAAGVLSKQHVAGQLSRAIATVRRGKYFLASAAPPTNSVGRLWPTGTWPTWFMGTAF
jgi:DNA-binding NarL/FixJ family response regulator